MYKKLKSFVDNKDYIHETHLEVFSDEAKDFFLKEYEDLGFSKCLGCSYYCREVSTAGLCKDCQINEEGYND